ncbi:angiogenic factor with G patch and FHA domains 1 isoform X1 [Ostrinia furnacalis]|uniref:angiogenic factor with G patch and FHA domains 1 isoform X1 n=1 Tax=Ostrinia furnacalis TaxID=93504 RepID=UPI00103BD245|nr:angiogenic factor with G patch and FHA domains 1 isoform X1 [Ostrinia furnacalis]
MTSEAEKVLPHVKKNNQMNLKNLRVSLRYRPKLVKLILKMRHCIRKKNLLLMKLKERLKVLDKASLQKTDSYCQTESESLSSTIDTNTVGSKSNDSFKSLLKTEESSDVKEESGWDVNKDGEKAMSIADQVKEIAQSALQQSGMVYVESAGMYYDYKTGYYYNSELGLYYHTDTGCYYYYCEEKKNFVFHSYPDRSAVAANAALLAHEKRKAKKHKKDWKKEDDIDNLTKNLAQGREDDASQQESQPKRRKTDKKKKRKSKESAAVKKQLENDEKQKTDASEENKEKVDEIFEAKNKEKDENTDTKDTKAEKSDEDLEDGECSESGSDGSDTEESSARSTSTASDDDDDDAVAKHHPPCMRVIVKETSLAKLKVGSLYLVTKDGGTVGREGDHHAIVLRDANVSRNHLDIRYDLASRTYMAMDLGSKNGTILNGMRMSESQVVSKPIEIIHGSILQLGETKLLCHIHPGKDTCGHCEPGLLLETEEKEKKAAYTRTCSVQKQHQLELARLKNKYAPQPKAIEETAYNDRAQARRTKVGSSHHAEKTQSADIDSFITPENKGFKLLEKMGWSKGEGLGKDNQGDTEPIPLVSNEGTAGLGATVAPAPKVTGTLGPATMRLANKTKMLRPPAKAFQNDDDDDDLEE